MQFGIARGPGGGHRVLAAAPLRSRDAHHRRNLFRLDSPRPTLPFRDDAYNGDRYRSLTQTRPDDAKQLLAAAQAGIEEKYRLYEEMAGREPTRFRVPEPCGADRGTAMHPTTAYLCLASKHPLVDHYRRSPATSTRCAGGRRGADRTRRWTASV